MALIPSTESNPGLREAAADIFASWRTELSQLAQILWTRLSHNDRTTLAILFDDQEVSVSEMRDGQRVPIGSIPYTSDERSFAATRLAQLCDRSDASRDVTLFLPASAVLKAQVALPKTSRRNLVQALKYELTRLSPLDPDQLYFDFQARPARSGKTQDIAIRIVKRATVDGGIDVCHQAGLGVASIRFGDDTRAADARLFPIDGVVFLRGLWRQWNIVGLAGLALLLGFLLFAAAYGRSLDAGSALTREVESARVSALFVEHLQQKAAAANTEATFLVERKRDPMLIGVFAELSRILPDNTWINQFSLDGNKLKLSGASGAAADLIALFGKSRLFANAQFTAPVTQESRSAMERFDLSADVRPATP